MIGYPNVFRWTYIKDKFPLSYSCTPVSLSFSSPPRGSNWYQFLIDTSRDSLCVFLYLSVFFIHIVLFTFIYSFYLLYKWRNSTHKALQDDFIFIYQWFFLIKYTQNCLILLNLLPIISLEKGNIIYLNNIKDRYFQYFPS